MVNDRPDVKRAAPTADVSAWRLIFGGLKEGTKTRAIHSDMIQMRESMGSQPEGRIPSNYLTRLWRAGIAAADDDLLGVKAASQWQVGRLHLADYIFETSANLRDAVTTVAAYSDLLNTAQNEIRLDAGPLNTATITYQVRSGDPAVDAQASQFALAVLLARARHAAGREIRPLGITFASAAPSHYRELGAWFGARNVDFGAPHASMTIAAVDLSVPLPGADASLASVLRQHATQLIAAQDANRTATSTVSQVIAQQLVGGGPSLTVAARQLALSPRSLQRRLADEGTTWRDLVDAVRRDSAAALLGTGLSKTAAAGQLGFSDARAFRAAAQRWRGSTSQD